MAKVSLARKKELNQPDEFINMSNRALEFARKNKNTLIAVISGVVACLVLIAGSQVYSQARDKKAFAQFAADMAWYEKAKSESETGVSLEAIKKRSDAFLDNYSGSPAGMLARSKYAGIYFQEGDYSSAAVLYEGLVSDIDQDQALKNIALCALAQSYEALDNTDAAISNYQAIVASENDMKKDEALFHLGLIYEKKGDSAKSKELYGRIVKDFSNSMFAEIAREKSNG